MAEMVGLVASVTQFAVYGFKAFKAAHASYNSATGLTDELADIEAIAYQATKTAKGITKSLEKTQKLPKGTKFSKDEIEIQQLAERGHSVAQELIKKLDSIKTAPTLPEDLLLEKKEKLKKAFRLCWKEKDIRELESRLQKITTALSQRSVEVIRENQYGSMAKLENEMVDLRKVLTDLKLMLERPHLDPGRQHSVVVKQSRLSMNLARLADITDDVIFEREVLRELPYEDLDQRWDHVKQSHAGTCSWAFDNKETHLLDWLQKEDDVYWIYGKPGSGKSTLMKHVITSRRTRTALEKWARAHNLVYARHFFWIAGTPMQKSLQGLYRSLLTQILEGEPRLIIPTCGHFRTKKHRSWGFKDLESAFQKIGPAMTSMEDLKSKLAVFIDGLDEYDVSENGHEFDVIRVVRSLAKFKGVKVCVSSRPWTVFKNEFEHERYSVAVHKYTFPDMQKYALDVLKELRSFRNASQLDIRWSSLAKEVATRAEGVWLWTSLVCKNVFREVADGESYQRAKAKLDGIPKDLDDYFRELVKRSNERYRGEGARILLLALIAGDYQNPWPLNGLGVCLMLEYKEGPSDAISNNELEISSELLDTSKIRDLLSNRCRDLLDIGLEPPRKESGKDPDEDATNASKRCKELAGTSVNFIHRTVRDFLQDTYYDTLHEFAGEKFNPQVSLLAIHLATRRLVQSPKTLSGPANVAFLIHAAHVDRYITEWLSLTDTESSKPSTQGSSRGSIHTQPEQNSEFFSRPDTPLFPLTLFQGSVDEALDNYISIVDSLGAYDSFNLAKSLQSSSKRHSRPQTPPTSPKFSLFRSDWRDLGFKVKPAFRTFCHDRYLLGFKDDPFQLQFLVDSVRSSHEASERFVIAVFYRLTLYVKHLTEKMKKIKHSHLFRTLCSTLLLYSLAPWGFNKSSKSSPHTQYGNAFRCCDNEGVIQSGELGDGEDAPRKETSAGSGSRYIVDLKLVSLLLDLGADPNERLHPFGLTPWTNHLLCHYSGVDVTPGRPSVFRDFPSPEDYFHRKLKIATLLVRRGADPNPSIQSKVFAFYAPGESKTAGTEVRLVTLENSHSPLALDPPPDLLAHIYGRKVMTLRRKAKKSHLRPPNYPDSPFSSRIRLSVALRIYSVLAFIYDGGGSSDLRKEAEIDYSEKNSLSNRLADYARQVLHDDTTLKLQTL
ncbi:hypothetical protein BJ508DRAFT_76942 [Ascobolus immersus RN42]|uniref:NACHT domain-containing protein n=1 Tax=Ascobolus immersus RN42 TaxID=1160509 RepID=A0A3N4HF42_ASCIM|nr:hypothetical protein BJ508DRAFT_76942 [Ascobolus immersus RN42]